MAIAFDSAGAGGSYSPSGTSNNLAHTCTGSNGVLLGGLLLDSQSVTATATYNGVAMTASAPLNFGTSRLYIFSLENPATGAQTLAVTLSGSCQSWQYAVSYTGAYQSTPFPDATNTATSAGSPITASVTTRVDNCWTMMWAANNINTNPLTASTGSTRRTTAGDGIMWFDSNGVITPAGSNSMSATVSSGACGAIIVSIAPTGSVYPSGAFVPFKTLMGVGI